MQLELRHIRIDGETQSRVELNHEVVEEYAAAMEDGTIFPPVVAFFDGAHHWLADGFHRYFGADQAGLESIPADVRNGTQLDAQLFSFGVNADHGLRRSNADKRKAVAGALQHPVSGKWSNNQIAKHCGVSLDLVNRSRNSLNESLSDAPTERTYTTKHGTEAVMNTANIGRKSAEALQESNGSAAPATMDSQAKGSNPPEAVADSSKPYASDEPKPEEVDEAPAYTELDHAHDVIQDLRAELAMAQMGDVSDEDKQQASRLIAELRAENKSLAAQLEIAEQMRNALLNENAAMKSQLARQRREIDKLKQGVAA